MVVCPQCGKPQDGDYYIEGVRDLTCSYCGWSGSSTEFVVANDATTKDPQVFDYLEEGLRTREAENFAGLLAKHGLIGSPLMQDTSRLVSYFSGALRTYVAGLTEGVLDPDALEQLDDGYVPSWPSRFMEEFADIEVVVVRLMIQLDIVKKDQDPRNLRYITRLLRFAFRKMWKFLLDELAASMPPKPQEQEEN